MNKKMTVHILMITLIMIATFIAAALTPVRTYAKTSEASAVKNIAKIDFENKANRVESKAIIDNEIPMAAMPFEADMNKSLGMIIISVSAIMAGIVIIEDIKDRVSDNIKR